MYGLQKKGVVQSVIREGIIRDGWCSLQNGVTMATSTCLTSHPTCFRASHGTQETQPLYRETHSMCMSSFNACLSHPPFIERPFPFHSSSCLRHTIPQEGYLSFDEVVSSTHPAVHASHGPIVHGGLME